VFVHLAGGFRSLQEGQTVEFDVTAYSGLERRPRDRAFFISPRKSQAWATASLLPSLYRNWKISTKIAASPITTPQWVDCRKPFKNRNAPVFRVVCVIAWFQQSSSFRPRPPLPDERDLLGHARSSFLGKLYKIEHRWTYRVGNLFWERNHGLTSHMHVSRPNPTGSGLFLVSIIGDIRGGIRMLRDDDSASR